MINYLGNFHNSKYSKYSSPYACQDQWICYIYFNVQNNRWEISNNNRYICNRKNPAIANIVDIDYARPSTNCNNLIFILESPHICEYDIYTHMPYGPAQGTTGCNICRYLENVLQNSFTNLKLNTSEEYRVVLLNAIQYQTSLGITPLDTEIRDYVFTSLWNESVIRDDLIQRIRYFTNNNQHNVVCNLCTKGNCNPSLHDLVSLCLNNNSITHLNGSHPSCWFNANNQTIV